MGSELYLKKGKESIWFGGTYSIFDDVHTIEEVNIRGEISNADAEFEKIKSNIVSLSMWQPEDIDEYSKKKFELEENIDYLGEIAKKLKSLYILASNIEDGWKIEIDY